MDKKFFTEVLNKTFNLIFNKQCPYTLKDFMEKFAFDIKLPQEVHDSITNQITYSANINGNLFITLDNSKYYDNKNGWMQKKRPVHDLTTILNLWKKINYITTERQYDCINVFQSDPMYNCENALRSTDCRKCRNIIFCDGCANCNYLLASQRSANSSFCIRTDDSSNCSNSYNVICSDNISNSYFIQDCGSLYECMFCSHISNKKFCISNMQFEEKEYFSIKEAFTNWILMC